MAKRHGRRNYQNRFKSLALVKLLILMVSVELAVGLAWMQPWSTLISIGLVIASVVFISAIATITIIAMCIILVALRLPKITFLMKKQQKVSTRRLGSTLSMWLLSDNYNDVVGDLFEDQEEMRLHGHVEWWIRFHLACKWVDSVVTSIPGALKLNILKRLRRAS